MTSVRKGCEENLQPSLYSGEQDDGYPCGDRDWGRNWGNMSYHVAAAHAVTQRARAERRLAESVTEHRTWPIAAILFSSVVAAYAVVVGVIYLLVTSMSGQLLRRRWIAHSALQLRAAVRLAVSDNGHGTDTTRLLDDRQARRLGVSRSDNRQAAPRSSVTIAALSLGDATVLPCCRRRARGHRPIRRRDGRDAIAPSAR